MTRAPIRATIRGVPTRVPIAAAVPAAVLVGVAAAAELWLTTNGPAIADLVAAAAAVAAVVVLAASERAGALLAVPAGAIGVAAVSQARLVPIVVGLVGVWLLVRRGLSATAVVAVAVLAAAAAWFAGPQHPIPGADLTPLMLVLVPVTATVAAVALARRRREQAARAERRARDREIEAQRGEGARAERARISRELHDLVAHSVSVVASLAEAAPYTVPDLPPAARTRFAEIGDAARGALTELRDLLAVLRRDEAPGTGADGLGPSAVPDLAGIERLTEEHRRAGHGVELRLAPGTGEIPIPAEIAAHRIVREALANVRRHADPGAHTRVVVERDGDALRVRVHDTGPSRPAAGGPGHGLLGIRERAEVLRGSMSAGPVGDGFAVSVEIPVAAGTGVIP